jgi:hypothetical protein
MILIAILVDMNGAEATISGHSFAYSRAILDIFPECA